MSWWQKKLLRYGLRYGLQRTGLLQDDAIDLDNLDITIGKKNVIELKNVGLNIKRISKLAQLPPSLRLETARVLSLRLTIPADFYQSSIVIEVDGVEITAQLEEEEIVTLHPMPKERARSPTTERTPQHRKMNRRLRSPPPYDPVGHSDSEDELHIPTTTEVAKSFYMAEPLNERKDIEALAYGSHGMEESVSSQSSDGGDVGTGIGIGVPGFLTSFLQGIVDRFKLVIRNVEVKVATQMHGDLQESTPITLRMRVGGVEVGEQGVVRENAVESENRRKIGLRDISLDLLSKESVLAGFSGLPQSTSSVGAKESVQSPRGSEASSSPFEERPARRPSTTFTDKSSSPASARSMNAPMEPTLYTQPESEPGSPPPALPSRLALAASTATVDADRFADAKDDDFHEPHSNASDLEIQPGDDNVSWGSRRSKTSAPANDLWSSMISEDDLPDSLVLEPERAPASRAHSSRGSSPFDVRKRRAVSPYERTVQSPGSWPRPEESPERNRFRKSPGSWPTIEQSRHTAMEPLDRVLTAASSLVVDNKQAALEQADAQEPIPEPRPEPEGAIADSMLESRVFSHEEAQSMYMSAMTSSPKIEMPGGWGSPTQSTRSASSGTPHLPALGEVIEQEDQDGAIRHAEDLGSGNATPRAQSPVSPITPPQSTSQVPPLAARQLLHIDIITIEVPTSKSALDETTSDPESMRQPHLAKSTGPSHGMPGTFSAYSEMSKSQRRGAGSVYADVNSVLWSPPETSSTPPVESCVDIFVGVVCVQLDIATGRLLYAAAMKVVAMSINHSEARKTMAPAANSQPQPTQPLSLQLESLRLSLAERISPDRPLRELNTAMTQDAIDIGCNNVAYSITSDGSVRFDTGLEILLGGHELVIFNAGDGNVTDSRLSSDEKPDISIALTRNRTTASKRPVTDILVQVAPIQLTMDLTAIDETFSSFGGLSGMIELGGSVLSENSASSPAMSKPPKGVRFAGEAAPSRTDAELKFNGRIGGVTATLKGPSCSTVLRTTALKAVHRETYTSAIIGSVIVSGPHTDRQLAVKPPIAIDLVNVRVEYLLTPQDKDLERLISLLTPSKDQYDDDGDILIDTLLRQRRKGAILKATIDDIKCRLDDWDCISTVATFSDDLAKLAAVTKYLPEDERPGLLTILRVVKGEVQLPVNERFGQLRLLIQELRLAHVGLPALLAFSIDTAVARQAHGPELLHPLLPPSESEALPVIMARMLGDEIEPTVKVKLFNIGVEYIVPVILDLTGMDIPVEPEELVNELAQSVANLVMAENPKKLERSPASDLSNPPRKRVNVSILVHDSAICLNPQRLTSKVMLVLTDTHLSTTVPPLDTMTAKLELRNGSIFVTDGLASGVSDLPRPGLHQTSASSTTIRLRSSLIHQGFVMVGQIMAAVVELRAWDSAQLEGIKAVEVDVTNQLFLLESCADSTQTLIATLSALAPPTPPSKAPKYLTQPMAIEDMMASFTGDPFIQPEEPPETLFDAQDPGHGPESLLGVFTLDEVPDDLLAQSEMTSSLYGPVSGFLGTDGDMTQSTIDGDYPETAESLLEEDPFEMTITPTDMYLGDAALMRDLNRQCKPAAQHDAVDLGLYEIEDLGFDALGAGQQALGTHDRFNAPYVGKLAGPHAKSQQAVPFKLRLRDINAIWHLHDGFDWQHTRDGIVNAVEQVEQRAEERRAKRRHSLQDREDEESVIGDFLFNSIYIGIPTDRDVQDLRRQINRGIDEQISETESVPVSAMSRPTTAYSTSGPSRQRPRRRLKLGRSKNHKISFDLKGVSADVTLMPPGGKVVSSVDLRLRDFEIFDRVPTSTWHKFLTHLESEPSNREMSKPMFHIQLDIERTKESHSASEIVLHVTVLPLRLHVDQDALDFITRFFEFKDPEMVVDTKPAGEQPFLQRVEVETVDMRLDYKPKTLDFAGLRSGKTTEFMNIITLEGSNIRLQHAIVYGLRGFDTLHQTLNDVWMPDIKRNQLPTVLAGLAPVRSLVNIGTGMRDVVAIPINEYRKDGRLVRSIQKGAMHFGKTTTAELARLGAKVALGTQTILSNVEEMISPSVGSSRPGPGRRISSDQGWHDIASDEEESEKRAVSAYANQPLGVLSGLRSARRHLEYDLLTAKDALIAVRGEILESRGPGDAAAAVVKHAPTVLLRPVIGATRAVGTTLLGVGNQIDRSNLRKVDDKYKRR